ncbi:hypothetical protein AVEN_163709-1 [Araneus ventricosus]|uniref:Uncharacterized protein n=1 Tax=Araneus ventricosus TaxID=182803 RepID=A0A4Y2HZN8_ARAVE|nr:hypothetical protein AVEN_163709-1 [Araneus ventricosus]
MDKSSADYEDQGDWRDCIHLPDTDNETNDSEILPRKRKRARRLICDSNEFSGVVDTSSEEWIWKKIDNVNEIKKFTGVPCVNALILR